MRARPDLTTSGNNDRLRATTINFGLTHSTPNWPPWKATRSVNGVLLERKRKQHPIYRLALSSIAIFQLRPLFAMRDRFRISISTGAFRFRSHSYQRRSTDDHPPASQMSSSWRFLNSTGTQPAQLSLLMKQNIGGSSFIISFPYNRL